MQRGAEMVAVGRVEVVAAERGQGVATVQQVGQQQGVLQGAQQPVGVQQD